LVQRASEFRTGLKLVGHLVEPWSISLESV